jgi:surface carbohydrate biosynthesis protein (TIGR04326 family)
VNLAGRPDHSQPIVTSANADSRLVVVDSPTTSPPAARCVAFWSSREVPAGAYSVPYLVEQQATRLRDEYISWTHDIGAFPVRGRDVRTRLTFGRYLSFWWMTLIAEKEPLRSAAIYKVFKLRALELLYRDQVCRGVLYLGCDRALARTMRAWCAGLGHPYQQQPDASSRGHSLAGDPGDPDAGPSRHFPHIAQAIWFLIARWVRQVRPARKMSLPSAIAGPRSTVVTFFPNVDLQRTRDGHFWSRYWEGLHGVLDESSEHVDWVWLYVGSGQMPYSEAMDLLDACNKQGGDKYRYFLLDQFVTPRTLVRALRIYARVVWAGVRLSSVRTAFRLGDSDLNFFPIMADDWRSSLFGVVAADGALQIAAFEEMARRMPEGSWLLFPWENQPWELALISAWRRCHLGRIIGAQHSALGQLALRSFVDPRELTAEDVVQRPMPDVLAVNGSGARDLMVNNRYPAERIVMTEALRYPGLSSVARKTSEQHRTLLIFTGYKRSETTFQLGLLADASRAIEEGEYERFLIKPHPFCPVEPLMNATRFAIQPTVTTEPISALWQQADVVFAANSTSAAIEAVYSGFPTAVCAPADEMNISPALGLGVPIVGTVAELLDFLRHPRRAICPSDYFVVDDALPRWRALLSGS